MSKSMEIVLFITVCFLGLILTDARDLLCKTQETRFIRRRCARFLRINPIRYIINDGKIRHSNVHSNHFIQCGPPFSPAIAQRCLECPGDLVFRNRCGNCGKSGTPCDKEVAGPTVPDAVNVCKQNTAVNSACTSITCDGSIYFHANSETSISFCQCGAAIGSKAICHATPLYTQWIEEITSSVHFKNYEDVLMMVLSLENEELRNLIEKMEE